MKTFSELKFFSKLYRLSEEGKRAYGGAYLFANSYADLHTTVATLFDERFVVLAGWEPSTDNPTRATILVHTERGDCGWFFPSMSWLEEVEENDAFV